MPHRDTSIAITQIITPALNATQGHKCSYQKSFYSNSKCHIRTQALAIYQALSRYLPYTVVSSQPEYSMAGGTITLNCNQSRVLILTNCIKGYQVPDKLIDVITIPTSLSLSHDLNQIMLRITQKNQKQSQFKIYVTYIT